MSFIHIQFSLSLSLLENGNHPYTSFYCNYPFVRMHNLTSLLCHEPNCWTYVYTYGLKIFRRNTPKIIYGYVAGQQPNQLFSSLICYLLKLQLPRYDFFTCVSHTFSPSKFLFFLFFVVCIHTVREVTMFMLVYLVGTNTSFYLRRN